MPNRRYDYDQKMQYAAITVTDIELAKDFYSNKLGFKLLVENPLPGGNKFIMVSPAKVVQI
jgi:catechol 2,3-dioxygenase-like lactoylglutathione lyase family enzyme